VQNGDAKGTRSVGVRSRSLSLEEVSELAVASGGEDPNRLWPAAHSAECPD
jgi:hypothetical protein